MIKEKRPIEYASALKGLIKGAIYREDAVAWNQIVTYTNPIKAFFEKLSLDVLVDEQEGFAFLKSVSSDDGKDAAGGLVVRRALSRNATALCVILREELHSWERSEREDQACVLTRKQLREKMLPYTRLAEDDSKFHSLVDTAITQACDSQLLRLVNVEKGTDRRDDQQFQIQRIIKARLPINDLIQIKNKLTQPEEPESEEIETKGADHATEHA
ncbi:MAG: DUF4194 domain-containing protein [Candidatus Altimarinota bacterium]